MENNIIKHWNNQEILGGIDCLAKNDEKVILLNCYTSIINGKERSYCSPLCKTTVESLEKYNKQLWALFDVFSNTAIAENGYVIVGGEGEMGNQGFIACTDSNNNFIWSLFFLNSNPFYKIEIIGNEIKAFSSSDLVYKFNLQKPEIIEIENLIWR